VGGLAERGGLWRWGRPLHMKADHLDRFRPWLWCLSTLIHLRWSDDQNARPYFYRQNDELLFNLCHRTFPVGAACIDRQTGTKVFMILRKTK
jgi:hypothetical protein